MAKAVSFFLFDNAKKKVYNR